MTQPTEPRPIQTATVQPIMAGKDEMNLAEFPLTKLGSRDHRDVLVYEGWGIDPQKKTYQQRWVVRGAAGLGLPNELGDRVVLALFALHFQQNLAARKVTFSRYQLLKMMKLDPEGKNCANLEHVLRQLAGITIESERAFYSKAQDKRVISKKAFHLVDQLWLRKYETDEQALETELAQGHIVWGKEIWDNLQAGYIKNLDLEFYYSLPSPLAPRLYRFLDKRMHYQDRFEVDIFEITGRLGQTAYTKPSEAYRKLKPALDHLIQAGFLASAEAVKRGKYTRVRLVKATQAERERQQERQITNELYNEQLDFVYQKLQTTEHERAGEQQLFARLKPQISATAYHMLTQCHLLTLGEGVALFGCSNVVVAEWVQKHLSNQIQPVLAEYAQDRQLKLRFVDLKVAGETVDC